MKRSNKLLLGVGLGIAATLAVGGVLYHYKKANGCGCPFDDDYCFDDDCDCNDDCCCGDECCTDEGIVLEKVSCCDDEACNCETEA